jgi:tetratricopeptide (TPR) repeat protein
VKHILRESEWLYYLRCTGKALYPLLIMQRHYFTKCLGLFELYLFVTFDVLKLSCLICSRGNQAYEKGNLTEAEECYTLGIDSFSPIESSRKSLMLCYSNRAATWMSQGKMRGALSDCRKATDIDSSFLKAQVRTAK